MESNQPSEEYCHIANQCEFSSEKLRKIQFDEIESLLYNLSQTKPKTVITKIYFDQIRFHKTKVDSPEVQRIKHEIDLVNEKFMQFHFENRQFQAVR